VAGDTSDLVLVCGGTASFTQSFVYLGSLLHRDLSDHHDVDARIKKPPRPLVRYVIISSVLAMCLGGSNGRSTLVVFWRYCCMGANRGASRLSPSLACATSITSAYVKCAGWRFVNRLSTKYLQRAYKSVRVSSRLSTTSQAALYSGLATSHACLRVGYPEGSCFRGYTRLG